MIANLPWYDFPELQWANDALWANIAYALDQAGLNNIPSKLSRAPDYEKEWTNKELLLSQACGLDVVTAASKKIQPLAVPWYETPDCPAYCYRSLVVVREHDSSSCLPDLRNTRCVFNGPTSHSGMNALRAMIAPLSSGGQFFSQVLMSGSHENSLSWLQTGKADVGAIDCITWELLRRHRPAALQGLRVLTTTAVMPAPPFVTSAGLSDAAVGGLQSALEGAAEDSQLKDAAEALGLVSIKAIDRAAYEPLLAQANAADRQGYWELPGLSQTGEDKRFGERPLL